MRGATRLAPAVAALALAACASTPTGDWDMAMISQTELERYSLRLEHAIDDQWLFADRALADFLDELGNRLAAQSAEPERAFRFEVVRSDAPTFAFSLPGGQVYVSRGLLALASSEDEVAWVLAHEIGHVTARHVRSRESKRELISFVTSIVTAPLFDPSQTLANALPGLITPSFSRADEREADDLGVAMVRAAGLDPACGARMLRAFADFDALTNARADGGVFDSHPESGERYARLVEADALAPAPACKREEYQKRLVGLRLDADDGTYSDANGDLILPSVGARIAGGAAEKLEASFPRPREAELRDPRSGVWLRIASAGAGSGRGVDVQLREDRRTGKTCVYRQWLEAGDDVYLAYSEFPARAREEWEPALARLAARVQPLSPEALAVLPLVPRVALHTVAEGETLDSIATHYGVWSAALLAVYNDRLPGAPLMAGEVLKVAERQPLPR